MPTFIQLEYIIAIDTHRNFGVAAQKCFVTQPTLSMQIRKAEEELGVIIFDRSKQPIVPTDVGEIVIEQARVILREKQRLNQLIDEFKGEVAGQLRLGIIPTLSPYLLPLFVGDWVRKYPKLHLQIQEMQTHQIIESLRNDGLDVGILVTPIRENHLRETPLFYEEILVYIHPNHALVQKEHINVHDLDHSDIWMLSEGNCFRNQVINLCSTTHSPSSNLPFSYESGSIEALKRLVDKEGGFTLLPELAVDNSEYHRNIRHIEHPAPLREVSLVFIRNFAKWRVLQLLAQHIQQCVPPALLNKQRGQVVEWQ